MGVKVREKRGKLYLDVYLGGKRTWEALHLSLTKDKEQNKEIRRVADIARSKRETQLMTGAWNLQDPVAARKKLVTCLEEYSKTYANPRIVGSLIYHVKKFNNGETVQIAQITPKWVDDFQNYFMDKVNKEELSQTSAAHYTKMLRTALKKATANNIINQNPAANVQRIRAKETDLVFLNFEELQRMAGVRINDPYGAEVRRAFLFACYTGLRVSGLETLTWNWIETNPTQIIKSQEKTKNKVFIPLGNSAQKLIIDGAEHDPPDRIFNLAGRDRRASYKYLKNWAAEAKVTKNVAWHTARRTFATMALENGADIYTVAKLLGHTGISQVAKYAKVTDRLRREAIAALPDIVF
jgi:site-specific recombinase XerD